MIGLGSIFSRIGFQQTSYNIKSIPLNAQRQINVKLAIEEVPVKIRCLACNKEWEVDTPMFKCPDCEDTEVKMLSGREIEISSMELADEEQAEG